MGITTSEVNRTKIKGKLIGRDIVWIQPSWMKREYIMLIDGEPRAMLRYNGWFSQAATIDGLGERWTFERKGFWRQEIEAEDHDTNDVIKPFRYNWSGGGKLLLDDGDELNYRHGTWGKDSYWETSSGEPLITFTRRSWWNFEIGVVFSPLAERYPELPTLIFLGFYLRLLKESDSSSAATVIVSS